MLTVEKLKYRYHRKWVLKGLDLCFPEKEVISILGPNGSGKTTLLKLLLGLYSPEAGRVLLDGKPVKEFARRALARRMAYVPQGHRLSFAFRVVDVVMMGRMPHKPFIFSYGRDDRRAATAALNHLQISHLAHRTYTELSGGERQLVLIARALAQGADILIMDEPVTGLDYGHQIRLLDRIAGLARNGYTCIKTTHYPDHALRISSRAVLLDDGGIVADGPAGAVVTPENLYRLYGTTIDIKEIKGYGHVCLPPPVRPSNPSDQKRNREELPDRVDPSSTGFFANFGMMR